MEGLPSLYLPDFLSKLGVGLQQKLCKGRCRG